MPILNMCSKPEEMPANGRNLRDISDTYRPSLSEYWTEEKRAAFKLYIYETHHGLCIKDYERNGYDDSDWYMIVWDEENQKPKEICFATTRGWS